MTSAGASQPFNLEVRAAIPGLFTTSSNLALIFNPDFSAATQLVPGNSYIVYANGLGGVQPVPASGAGGATSEPLNRVIAPVQIVVGETAITPDFCGIAPGLVNVDQINFTLPANFVPATDRIFVQTQGWQSNAASIPVSPSNLVAQGTVQALYPYTPPGGGTMPPVTFGLLLEGGSFTAQATLPSNGQPVRIAAVTDAGSTVVRLDDVGGNWSCQATQTAVAAPELQGNFNFLLPELPIIDFAAGSSLRPFPNNIIPVSRLDPVWMYMVGILPTVNSVSPPNLNGSIQSTCTVGTGGTFFIDSTTNAALSTFGGLRMLSYDLFPTSAATFKLYVNGAVVAQSQVQYPIVSAAQ
jgi:hypothetical protein